MAPLNISAMSLKALNEASQEAELVTLKPRFYPINYSKHLHYLPPLNPLIPLHLTPSTRKIMMNLFTSNDNQSS